MSVKDRQGFGVDCLMRSHCRPQRASLAFLFGVVLGITLGCTATLTFVLHLERMTVSAGTSSMASLIPSHIRVENVKDPLYEQEFNPPRNKFLDSRSDFEKGNQNTVQDNIQSEDFLISSVNKDKKKLFDMSIIGPSDQLKTQYSFRKSYLVAIMTSQPDKGYVEAIYDTWARDIADIKFFMSPTDTASQLNVEGVPIIQLPPPTSKSHYNKAFQVLEYLHLYHLNDYNWFVLAPDQVYMDPQGLEELLSHLDPNVNTYIGHPTTADDIQDTYTYCLGTTGLILSQATVDNLIPELDRCRTDTGDHWDKELGHCLGNQLNTLCAREASEAQIYFVLDEYRRSQSIESLWEDSIFMKALTIAPVVSEDHMYLLHFHYKVRHFTLVSDKWNQLQEDIRKICLTMPKDAPDNPKILNHCVELHPESINGEEIGHTNQQEPINKPSSKFHPMNRFQVQSWSYFDAFNIFDDESILPRKTLKTFKYYSIELQKALQEAVKAASRQYHAKLRFKKIINGYVRHNALLGNEYIIDARFVEARNPRKKVEKRIRLLRPLTSSFLVQPAKNNITEKVHFIVPLTKITDRFNGFLRMYERLSLSTNEKTRLVLAVYGEEDLKQIQKNVTQYQKKYAHAEITVIQGYGEFSRAKALDLGMSKLEHNDLAFFCDVDMDIDAEFLTKCRQNTEQGQSIYFPEVFKLYNRKYVYKNGWRSKRFSINREQGHWGYYAYGMVCIYRSDYKAVGGLDKKMTGWGGEDVDFYEKVLHSSLSVLRAPDTSLIHRWHPKTCKMDPKSKMYEHCLMSKAEVLADRRELARYIFDLESG